MQPAAQPAMRAGCAAVGLYVLAAYVDAMIAGRVNGGARVYTTLLLPSTRLRSEICTRRDPP